MLFMLAVFQWVKCVRKVNAGVVPQAIFQYMIATICYAFLRIIVQYNKLSLFFANWHVLCEIVLLLNILQGEEMANRMYDLIIPILWIMSTAFVFIPFIVELYFMQPFGFVADNMLVWVQLIAFWETKLPCYLWSVIGAIIHVVMLTVGILDPVMGESGIGLAIASLLLVPMFLFYTVFCILYVRSYKERHWIPYLNLPESLGGMSDDPQKKVHLVELTLRPRAKDVANILMIPREEEKQAALLDLNSPLSPMGAGPMMNGGGMMANGGGQMMMNGGGGMPNGGAQQQFMEPLSPTAAARAAKVAEFERTGLSLYVRRRKLLWIIGFIVGICWLIILFGALSKL